MSSWNSCGLLLVVVSLLVACGHSHDQRNGEHGHTELDKAAIITLVKDGHSGAEILKRARGENVKVFLSDDDVIELVEAGLETDTINALLELAKKKHTHAGGHGH